MLIDCNIGGSVDGTSGADLSAAGRQITVAERLGFDGVWTTEVGRDPFLPLMLACGRSSRLQLGTAVAVAFARNPMTVAATAHDLQGFSSGRFTLGLGSQVKAHVTRRFGMPWSEPAERMREFVAAVRAIWACWQDGTRLSFEGRFYRHTLMTPMFTPDANPWGTPPIMLAAVGSRMTTVAAEAADGLILHSFMTEAYLRDVTHQVVAAGLQTSGRDRSDFTVSLPGLVATGVSDKDLRAAQERVRAQVAFYGATPAYRGVLDLHGLGGLHEELHGLSTRGRWEDMNALVDDEILDLFAVVGSPAEAGREIVRRYGGLVDRFTLATPYPATQGVRRTLLEAVAEARP